MTTLKNDNLSDTSTRRLYHDHALVGPLWVIEKCKTMVEDHQLGLITASTYRHLYGITLPNLYNVCKNNGITVSHNERVQYNKPLIINLHDGEFGYNILCRSLDNYESLAGVELSWVWSDESYPSKSEALDLVNERLRDYTNNVTPQYLITKGGNVNFKISTT